MPEESWWNSFFDPATVLRKMELTSSCRDVVEFGCGYGTFSVAAARIISGNLYAVDIEPEMIQATQEKATSTGLSNIVCIQRDFVQEGTGLPENSIDYVMMFNILHAESPEALLREAWKILVPGGRIGIVHWNYDPSTPRGPSMEIRPKPEQCQVWAESVGFISQRKEWIDLPPHHYGLLLQRPID